MERKVCWLRECVSNRSDGKLRVCNKRGKLITPGHGTRLCYGYKERRWHKEKKKRGGGR